jgi:hypothetical protein
MARNRDVGAIRLQQERKTTKIFGVYQMGLEIGAYIKEVSCHSDIGLLYFREILISDWGPNYLFARK